MDGRETPPPPVHVHVPEATPVHVHMKRSPGTGRKPPVKTFDSLSKDGRRSKARPWIPPGKTPTRRNVDAAYDGQRSRCLRRSGPGVKEGPEPDGDDGAHVSRSLAVLLKEEQETDRRRSRKSERGAPFRDTDELLRALVEADIDGAAVTNQLGALKDTADGLSAVKRLTKMHTASLGRQRRLLLEKIEMFASTSQSLRALLREWSEQERESLLWSEQRDALKKRLADCEADNVRLGAKLSNREKEVSELAETLDLEKESRRTSEELSRLLESTRAHLEAQLDRARMENAQLDAQTQRLQRSQDQAQLEVRSLTDELRAARRCRDDEERDRSAREAERAERAEEEARRLADKLQQKELQLAQALCSSSEWCARHQNEASAKEQLEQDIPALKRRVAELVEQVCSSEEQDRAERERLGAKVAHVAEQNAALNAENGKLKVELSASEDRLRALQCEARGLKSLLRKHESQVDKYRKKVRAPPVGNTDT